jgi:hypothetical protein
LVRTQLLLAPLKFSENMVGERLILDDEDKLKFTAGQAPVTEELAVTVGMGFTVTVMVNVSPEQFQLMEVGVTMYCTVPAVELLGLTSIWFIVSPEPAAAPVIPPVIVPMVQAKVEGVLEVSERTSPAPLQTYSVAELVITGFGCTVTVILAAFP